MATKDTLPFQKIQIIYIKGSDMLVTGTASRAIITPPSSASIWRKKFTVWWTWSLSAARPHRQNMNYRSLESCMFKNDHIERRPYWPLRDQIRIDFLKICYKIIVPKGVWFHLLTLLHSPIQAWGTPNQGLVKSCTGKLDYSHIAVVECCAQCTGFQPSNWKEPVTLHEFPALALFKLAAIFFLAPWPILLYCCHHSHIIAKKKTLLACHGIPKEFVSCFFR